MGCDINGKVVNDIKQFAERNNNLQFGNFTFKTVYSHIENIQAIHGKFLENAMKRDRAILSISHFNNPKIYKTVRNYIKSRIALDIEYAENDVGQELDVDTIDQLQKVYDNFDSFMEIYQQVTKIVSGYNTEDYEEVKDIDESQSPRDILKGNEQSAWESADIGIRTLFSTLQKAEIEERTGRISLVFAENGLSKMSDYTSLYTNVLASVSEQNIKTDTEFFNYLFSSEMIQKYPELDQLSRIFDIKDAQLDKEDQLLLYQQFYKSFVQAKINIYSQVDRAQTTKEDGVETTTITSKLENQTKNNVTEIKRKFSDDFEAQDASNPHLTYDEEIHKLYITSLPKYPTSDVAFMNFLELLGIKIKIATYDKLQSNPKTGQQENQVERLYNAFQKLFKLQPGFKLDSPMSLLLNGIPFDTKYSQKIEPTNKDNKDNISKYIYREIIPILNDIANTESEFNSDKPSLAYFNADGNLQYGLSKEHLVYSIVSDINKAKTLDELYELNPDLAKNTQWETSVFRNELFDEEGNRTKKVLEVGNYNGSNNKINGEGITTKSMNERQKMLMDIKAMLGSKYRLSEMPTTEAAASFFLKIENYEGFDLLDDKWKDQISSYIKNSPSLFLEILDGNNVNEISDDKLKELIDAYIDKRVIDFTDLFAKYEITQAELGNIDISDAKTFIVNYFINSAEAVFLTFGNPLVFKDFTKRWKFSINTGISLQTNQLVEDFILHGLKSHYLGDISLASQLGITKREDVGLFRSTIQIDPTKANNKRKALKLGKKVFKEIESTFSEEEKAYYKTKDGKKDFKRLKQLIEDSYNDDTKIADGQGWIHLDGYREFQIIRGTWNEKYQGMAYMYNMLKFKEMHTSLTAFESSELEKLTNLVYGEESYKYSLPPLKDKYSGGLESTTEHVTAIDKFSLAPILPANFKTKDAPLIQLMMNMVNNSVHYTKAKSASKGYVNENKINEGISQNKYEVHRHKYLFEQIESTNEQKLKTTWGTQFRKLIFSTLFNKGKAGDVRAQELYDNYINILKNIATEKREKLQKKLGFSLEFDSNNRVVAKISDFTLLNNKIREKAIDKGFVKVINSLYVTENGQLLNLYEDSGIASEVSDLLFGMMDKELRIWKVEGNQYVQMSNAFHEELDFYKYDVVTSKTNPAGARITLSGEYLKLLKKIHPDGEPIKNITRLNNLLNDKEWVKQNIESISLVGYRIPTQSPNSMEFLQIKEFLDITSGSVIQLYDDVVTKSGGDFDIDKLSIFTPSFDLKGNLLRDSREVADAKLKEYKNNVLQPIIDYALKNKTPQIENDFLFNLADNIKTLKTNLLKGNFKTKRGELTNISGIEEDRVNIEDLKVAFKSLVNLDAAKSLLNDELTEDENRGDDNTQEFSFKQLQYDNLRKDIDDLYDEYYSDVHSLLVHTSKSFVDEILKDSVEVKNFLYIKYNQYKRQTNELNKIYKDVLSLPSMYKALVTPNTTEDIKNIFDRIKELREIPLNESELPKGEAIFDYTENLKANTKLTTVKSHLGVYAVLNTLIQQFNIEGLEFNLRYAPDNKGKMTKEIPLNLLSEEEATKLINTESGTITVSNAKDSEGVEIQKYIDQLISITVDVAKDTSYAGSGVNYSNISIVVALMRLQVPFARIITFINTPLVYNYYQGIDLHNTSLGKAEFETKFFASISNGTVVNATTLSNLEPSHYTLKEMEKFISDLSWESNKEENLELLATALRLDTFSTDYRSFTSYFNQDTKKVNGKVQAEERIQKGNILGISSKDGKDKQHLVPSAIFHKINENSLYSLYNNDELISAVSTAVLPILYNKGISEKFADYMQNKVYVKNKSAVEKKLLVEYIDAVYKTFGQYRGEGLFTYGLDQMQNRKFLNRFNEIIKTEEWKNLAKKYSLLDKIKPDVLVGEKVNDITNIQIVRTTKDSVESNILFEEYTALLNSPDVSPVLKEVLRDMVIIGFVQGNYKSKYYFLDIVPAELHREISSSAWDKLRNLNPTDSLQFFDNFGYAFKENNPSLGMLRSKIEYNNNTDRIKNYNLKKYQRRGAEEKEIAIIEALNAYTTPEELGQRFMSLRPGQQAIYAPYYTSRKNILLKEAGKKIQVNDDTENLSISINITNELFDNTEKNTKFNSKKLGKLSNIGIDGITNIVIEEGGNTFPSDKRYSGSYSGNIFSDNTEFNGKTFEEVFSGNTYNKEQKLIFLRNRFIEEYNENPLIRGIHEKLLLENKNSDLHLISNSKGDILYSKGGKLFLNLHDKTLNYFQNLFDKGVNLDKMLPIALFEEQIHNIVFNIIKENNISSLDLRDEQDTLGSNTFLNKLSKIYQTDSFYSGAHESIRIKVQNEILGYITEDVAGKNKTLIRKIIEWLSELFSSNLILHNNIADKTIDYIKTFPNLDISSELDKTQC